MAKTKLVISGPVETKQVLLNPKGATLGRGSDCDVILDDAAVSRVHARVSQDPFGRWIVEDLDSQNGILIEGHRVQAQAVLPGQKISIRPFTISVVQESDHQVAEGAGARSTILIMDETAGQDVVSYKADQASILSPALIHDLNELTERLLKLSSPAELYCQACLSLAEMLDTLVAIVRLPRHPESLPKSPDVLAFNFGAGEANVAQTSYLHFSRRVLDAIRSKEAPVMAGSGKSSGRNIALTIVDEHKPHVVFSARVNELGETIDALYLDILEQKSSKEMFDFVEAAARQINFVQKSLFFIELQKQQEALRQANLRLQEKDRIKDEYVSRVTHDIKGHLAAIQSCLYIAGNESIGPLNEKQSDFMQRASRRTTQLTGFVKELLNLTQMRLSGRLEMQAFSVPECLSKALAAVANRAQEKSIAVTSNVDPSVGQIIGNEFSVNEMISNLLFNAVKYTPENKTVHLEAKGQDDHVRIDVVDTGIGIPADELEHVFDEFFRATNAQKTEKDGTGLGLSIVKQIVEQHGGRISAESREGQGTAFTVTLPLDSSTPVCS
ncbi:MAG: FHA domain-containing protein [Phycisphaerales bacterium]|nr:MAG: FHA domain-containing protein [Phycisphaerales bacterium]